MYWSNIRASKESRSMWHRKGKNRIPSIPAQIFLLFWPLAIVFGFMHWGGVSSVWSAGLTNDIVQAESIQKLELPVGKSMVLNSGTRIKRASLAHPDLAETLVLSPTQLYIRGKAVGTTNLTFWGGNGRVFAIYDVHVVPDLTRLKEQLHELFPEESLQIRTTHEHITVSGSVSGPDVVTQVLQVAETYAPQKVMNLLQVGGVQQVMLEVQIAEMSRSLIRRLGFNLHRFGSGGNFSLGTLGGLSSFNIDEKGVVTILSDAATTGFLGFDIGSEAIRMVLDALKQHNLTKILAEPTLVTVSGQQANFLAGGEFPIPVPQAFGVTTIKFKKFGVSLGFTPTVLSGDKISLKIAPEVSEIDNTIGLNTSSISVPGLLTRRAETIIELKDGQTFAIAGLIQDNVRETIAKYPMLGELPILGALFRSTSFQKNETELVILVTPRLVKPLDMTDTSLPTDAYLEPNDFEFMLMGLMEGRRQAPSAVSKDMSESTPLSLPVPTGRKGGLEGPFGHLIP